MLRAAGQRTPWLLGLNGLARGKRTTASEQKMPLAFVNRYAEALDVLLPNLSNLHCIKANYNVKFDSPLAAQPPGTGKTELGLNLTAILRRPREADAGLEARVAQRLREACYWRGVTARDVDIALRDGRDENLLVRTLLVSFPHLEDMVLGLKQAEPLVVQMKYLVKPSFGLTFNGALAFAIFCEAAKARGLRGTRAAMKKAFLAQCKSAQSATGALWQLIEERGGKPLVLVLDGISNLEDISFEAYFKSVAVRDVPGNTPLYRAMAELNFNMQLLHSVPGCFVYCTGLLLSRSLHNLAGTWSFSASPLMVKPVVLRPLTTDDIRDTLAATAGLGGPTLLDDMGVAPAMVDYFVSRVQALTGGVGSVVQHLLRERQQEVTSEPDAAPLQSHREVDAALECLRPLLPQVSGMWLRVNWNGPMMFVTRGELPEAVLRKDAQERLLGVLVRLLLLDAPFHSWNEQIAVGDRGIYVSDAAVAFGFTYGPAAAPSSQEASEEGTSSTHLRVIAGEWMASSLATDPLIAARPSLLPPAQLLAALRRFGRTMRGRPFELLCADALCARAAAQAGSPLGLLLPHLSSCARSSDVVPCLQMRALPKVVDAAPRLDDAAKDRLLLHRERWAGGAAIHAADLPWLLRDWLPVGCLGVPVEAQSGTQDLFLRLGGGVVGFALKRGPASAGSGLADVATELSKAPALPPDTPYTLVLWSAHLGPQLGAALGSAPSAVYGAGTWRLRDGKLVPGAADEPGDEPVFTVGTAQELVVTNPYAPCGGGGLCELLGSDLFDKLRVANSAAAVQAVYLTEWMDGCPGSIFSAPKQPPTREPSMVRAGV